MLLLDSTNLSVYEVADDTLKHWARLPPSMAFERFEATARSHVYGLFLAAHMPNFRVGAETLVFVRLAQDRGWAWASRIRIAHHRQLPIADLHIGEEFLFLWPVPMAINAYINFKEAARRSIALTTFGEEEATLMTFVDAVKAHPPSIAFLPQQFRDHDMETVREVRAKDLTVPQRLFVASLAPHSTAFATRSPTDKWSDTMRAQDQKQLDRFLKRHNATDAFQKPGDSDIVPVVRARARPFRSQHNAQRRRRRSSVFDLPDDLVERIVCIHLAQSMDRAEEAQMAAAHARYVNRQFRRTTNAAIAHMLRTVTEAAHSLLGPLPREPAEVQRILFAAGLTLRHALTMPPVRWRSYVRRRFLLEKHDSEREPPVYACAGARQRCALLWGILGV